MTQYSFVFSAAANGAESWDVELDALRSAVAHLTVKEVAHQLDVSRSAIEDALKERESDNGNVKRWAGRWTHVVRAMLMQRGDEKALDLVEQILTAQTIGTQLIVDEIDFSDAEVEAAQRVLDAARRRKQRVAKRDRKKNGAAR